MSRLVSDLLLIAALLGCPLNCNGVFAKVCDHSQEQGAVSVGCKCCPHHQAPAIAEDAQPLRSPDEDCTCGSCLCHGAVRGDDPFDDSFAEASFFAALECVVVEGALPVAERPHAWKPPPDGLNRDICILHQSLLL